MKMSWMVKKAEDKANSLQIKSFTMLPEDSLNVIAQMTLGTKAKTEKRNVVSFGEETPLIKFYGSGIGGIT